MLHERSEPEPAREPKPGEEDTARGNWIALGSGVLLGILTANSVLSYLGNTPSSDVPPYYDISFPPWTAWLSFRLPGTFFLLLPLALGIILPFTGGILNKRKKLISLVFARSTLVWIGVCFYWFPLALYEDSTWTRQARIDCQRVNDHGFCGLHLGASGFFVYLFFSFLLLLLFAMMTTGIITLCRKHFSQRVEP